MLVIEALADYLEDKVQSLSNPRRGWYCRFKGSPNPWDYRIELRKLNKNCYSYRLYDNQNICLLRGASIRGIAAYLSPSVHKVFRQFEQKEVTSYRCLISKWGLMMTLESIIRYLRKKFEEAKQLDYIEKPIAWALYQTWRYVDGKEKPRQDKEVIS